LLSGPLNNLSLGPKFSKKDRAAILLRREYSLNQVAYALNGVFRRHCPIHKIFERSAELGLFNLTADKIAQIFGVGGDNTHWVLTSRASSSRSHPHEY
jgi:hypothetical protein